MRHRKAGRKLGRNTKHRRAMLRNMVTDFFRLGRIRTTDQKAKELRRTAERLITKAKADTLAARRLVAEFVRDKSVVKKLFEEIAPLYKERPGGYTRVVKLGVRRGDGAAVSLVELVEEEYKPKARKKKRAKKAAPAAAAGKDTSKSAKKAAAKELGVLPEEGGGAETPADEARKVTEPTDEGGAGASSAEASSEETEAHAPEKEGPGAEAPPAEAEPPTAMTEKEAADESVETEQKDKEKGG